MLSTDKWTRTSLKNLLKPGLLSLCTKHGVQTGTVNQMVAWLLQYKAKPEAARRDILTQLKGQGQMPTTQNTTPQRPEDIKSKGKGKENRTLIRKSDEQYIRSKEENTSTKSQSVRALERFAILWSKSEADDIKLAVMHSIGELEFKTLVQVFADGLYLSHMLARARHEPLRRQILQLVFSLFPEPPQRKNLSRTMFSEDVFGGPIDSDFIWHFATSTSVDQFFLGGLEYLEQFHTASRIPKRSLGLDSDDEDRAFPQKKSRAIMVIPEEDEEDDEQDQVGMDIAA